jgi:UDP-glucose 4-epimerase
LPHVKQQCWIVTEGGGYVGGHVVRKLQHPGRHWVVARIVARVDITHDLGWRARRDLVDMVGSPWNAIVSEEPGCRAGSG